MICIKPPKFFFFLEQRDGQYSLHLDILNYSNFSPRSGTRPCIARLVLRAPKPMEIGKPCMTPELMLYVPVDILS